MRILFLLLLALAWPAQAAPEKVLRYAFNTAETGFDGAKVFDLYSRTVVGHIFEAPLGYDPLAEPVRIVPMTARGMPEISADFRTFTVRIQPGIYFADDPVFKGRKRELVAEDYVYALKRFADPANKSPTWSSLHESGILGLAELRKKKPFDYDTPIEGLRALDRYTFQVKLAEPRPRFIQVLADNGTSGAVAREVIEHYGDESSAHPVGTGPYRLKQWRRSSLIVLERNPGYREVHYEAHPAADDAAGQAIAARLKGRRLPMIDRVEVAIIEEPQPFWLSFVNGEQDLINWLPGEFVNVAVPGGKLAPNLAKRGIQHIPTLASDGYYFFFNMEDAVVGGYTPEKVALRRAISLAWDVDRDIRLLRRGQAVPAQSALSPYTSGYDPRYKSEISDYDPARANALLDLYGYVDRDGDGWRDMPDGSPLVIEWATQPDATSRAFNELAVINLKRIHIRVAFKTAKWAENLQAARAGKLMVWNLGGSASSDDGLDALAGLYGPQSGSGNYTRFKLAEFDGLYDRMQPLPDGPERDALFLQAKRLQAAYMPIKSLGHRILNDLAEPWVIGYRRPRFRLEFWQYLDIDLDKKNNKGMQSS